jgi:hypothetical protein
MTPIDQACTCEPMKCLHFLFVESLFVFVGQTLAVEYLKDALAFFRKQDVKGQGWHFSPCYSAVKSHN